MSAKQVWSQPIDTHFVSRESDVNNHMQDAAAIITQIRHVRDAVYASGKICGKTGKEFDVWPTGLTAQAGEYLRDLVTSEKPSRTIETGLAYGLSSLFILEGVLSARMEMRGTLPRMEHVAIDPYQHVNWDGAGLEMLYRCGLDMFVRHDENDSALQLPLLVSQKEQFDFGFVDGGHNYEHVFLDVYYMHRLVRPGGLVVVDDVWMPAIQAAVAFFTTNCGTERIHVPQDSPGKRFAVLRTPTIPLDRAWDHFVPFWDAVGEGKQE